MKSLTFLMLLVLSVSSYSRTEDHSIDCGEKGIPSNKKNSGGAIEFAEKMNDAGIEELTSNICAQLGLISVNDDEDSYKVIESTIMEYLNLQSDSPQYKMKIATFFNENKEKFICKETSARKVRTPQHFFKRVIDLQVEGIIFDNFLLQDEDEFPIDVNAIEIYNGKPETVLDYIYSIIESENGSSNRYDLEKINEIREILEDDYGAKRAEQLTV